MDAGSLSLSFPLVEPIHSGQIKNQIKTQRQTRAAGILAHSHARPWRYCGPLLSLGLFSKRISGRDGVVQWCPAFPFTRPRQNQAADVFLFFAVCESLQKRERERERERATERNALIASVPDFWGEREREREDLD
nr:hypothetical protein [Pandoravirus belohorizontensis]